MRGESHRRLGKYLAEKYLADTPECCVNAFLFGCIQPDRNPVTYLKGSLRAQWLRGHNYRNARRFMARISRRLERRESWSLFDYYTLGKLIHYITDAFTSAHNDCFSTDLGEHMEYEQSLQAFFLEYLKKDPQVDIRLAGKIMDAVQDYHAEYSRTDPDIHRDSHFAVSACCCVLAILFMKPII